jgi:hypothetical protein
VHRNGQNSRQKRGSTKTHEIIQDLTKRGAA